MRLLCALLLWCLLLVVCWPLALLVMIVFPFVWLLSLPFRLLAAVVEGMLALIRGLLLLPGRILGVGRESASR